MDNDKEIQQVELTGLVENPQKLINNAALVAGEFNKIVSGQKMFTDIQGKKHIHADGWSMLGVLLGVFPEVVMTERVKSGTFLVAVVRRTNRYNKPYDVLVDKERMKKNDTVIEERTKEEIKYKAVVALNTLGGRKLAQITTMCSNREDGKVDNDEYAIESMAQTRGVGKVYRTAFGWIAKMAGYDSTPFEEATAEMYEEAVKPPATAELMDSIFNRIDLAKDEKDLAVVVDSIASYSKELNEGDTKALRQAVIAKRGTFKKPEAPKKAAPKKELDRSEEKMPVPTPPDFVDEKTGEIHDVKTGPVDEQKAEEQKKVYEKALDPSEEKEEPRAHRAVKKEPSKYWTMTKISSVVDGLNTTAEVRGFTDELNTLYNDGELTDSVYKFGITNCQVKMNKLTNAAREASGQSSLISHDNE
jgi:hypothetical protein